MDLSLAFCAAVVADLVILRFIPVRRRVARFVCRSIFFAVQTALLVALVGSPLRPGLQTPRLASRVLVPNFGLLLVGLGCARTDQFSRVADRDPENVYREQTSVRYYRGEHLCLFRTGHVRIRFWIAIARTGRNFRHYRDCAWPGSPKHPRRCLFRNITEH